MCLPGTCPVTFLFVLRVWPLEHLKSASPRLQLCAVWKVLIICCQSAAWEFTGCPLYHIQWETSENYSLHYNIHILLHFPSVVPQHLSLRYFVWHSFWTMNFLPWTFLLLYCQSSWIMRSMYLILSLGLCTHSAIALKCSLSDQRWQSSTTYLEICSNFSDALYIGKNNKTLLLI